MAPGRSLAVLPTASALATAAAERVIDAARAAVDSRGEFILALSSGSTPRALYTLLAATSYANRIEWERVQVLWSDERCVPPADAASNYGMAQANLLSHVPVQASNVHRIRGEEGASVAAASYERELRLVLRTPDGPPRMDAGARIDLALLGLGEDGHTASLFPGMLPAVAADRFAAAVPASATPRVTLTAPVLNAAAAVVFLVSGSAKAPIVDRILGAPRRLVPEYPAQLIVPEQGQVHWMLDADAAAQLEGRS
jgi:6-phosphogluconolactonase